MNATREEWRPVPGYEGHYEASSFGRIRSLKRPAPHIMSPRWNPQVGKYMVVLRINGGRRNLYVHSLVAAAFYGPRPEGKWACHNDDDSRNNRADNLRWDTPSANHRDMVRLGNHHYAKRTHCKNGHEFTPENTGWRTETGDRYVVPTKARKCLTCQKIRNSKSSNRKG